MSDFILTFYRYGVADEFHYTSLEEALTDACGQIEWNTAYPDTITCGGEVLFDREAIVEAYGDYYEHLDGDGSANWQRWLDRIAVIEGSRA